MTSRLLNSWIACTVLLASLGAQGPASEVEATITAATLAGPIKFLASDEMEGRGVGSRSDVTSRRWFEGQFQLMGLEGGLPDGGFQQRVPIVGIRSRPTVPLTIRPAKGVGVPGAAEGDADAAAAASFELSAPADYVAWADRPEAQSAWRDLEIVFVGYGIQAPEYQWDDFKDVDVRGKVLLVMNNDPSADPALFAGKTRLYYGRWSYKYEEAARRGAAGAIVIHTDESAGYPFQVIQTGQDLEQFHLPFDPKEPALAIRAWCSNDAAGRIARAAGRNLDDLRAAAEKRDFRPVPLGVPATLVLENTVREFESGNTVARLPGSDPALAKEAVVVTAHFDHLGIGRAVQGDTIYNGALDNASGCSALVNLAMACSRLRERPRRSLVFAAVTAEESGLLGSLFYARNPTVPPKQIVANLNIDGINMWGPTRDVAMIGYGKNSLSTLAGELAKARGRELLADPEVDKGLFYRSDHFNFARIGVPCAYFKAGNEFLENAEGRRKVKQAYTTFHYHQPSDEFDDRWNLEGAVQDVRLMLDLLLRVANDPKPPAWTPGDEFEKAR